MKVLNEIISSLSNEQCILIDALMKTKVLLHRLGRKDLAGWVNLEINGYGDNPVPDYRVLHAVVRGVVSNGVYIHNDHPLPVLHLEEQVRKRFTEVEIRDSIAVLEGLAKNDNHLSLPIPLEGNSLFSSALQHGYKVQRSWCSLGSGQLSQVFAQVRSRLLDFLLELSDKVDEMTDDEVKRVAQSPEMGSMFNNAIFGNNTTIQLGNQNYQTVTNQIIRGDFASLETALRKSMVESGDIDKLRAAIQEDAESEDVKAKGFGPRVKDWMKAMTSKAIDGTWEVQLSVASNLITEALKAYYGW